MAWQTHYVGHLRAVNNNFLDTYQLKSQNAILDGIVLEIDRSRGTAGSWSASPSPAPTRSSRNCVTTGSSCCTGFRIDAAPFADECRPELTINDRFAALTSAYESVNVPGLYFAGTLMQQRDFKKSTSGFIHGFRYAVRALLTHPGPARTTACRGRTARCRTTPSRSPTPCSPGSTAAPRCGSSSACWPTWSCCRTTATARYLRGGAGRLRTGRQARRSGNGLPIDARSLMLAVTLEYGPDHDKVDPFDITVRRAAQNDTGRAHDAAYLHPVIRAYRNGELLAEHHLAENLENEWDGELTPPRAAGWRSWPKAGRAVEHADRSQPSTTC